MYNLDRALTKNLTCLSEIHGRESVDEAVNIAEGELLMSKTMGVSPWFFIK
jgi:hypothetical protein